MTSAPGGQMQHQAGGTSTLSTDGSCLRRFTRLNRPGRDLDACIGVLEQEQLTATIHHTSPLDQPYVIIEDIYVRPDFRNTDIGGALLERVFAVAQQEGIARFTVGTLSKETDRILKFYRSHGFTPWRIQFFK